MSTRRTFIHQAALGTAALAATPFASVYAHTSRTRRQKIGIALVGLGYYSADLLAPALQECSDCYLAGVVTGTPSKAEAWMAKYDIPEANVYDYDSYDDLADNDAIDAVYVVLPNAMHAEYTIRAANAGKHVICEKPMAMNTAECIQMMDACAQNKVKLSIGYRMQFEPHTQAIMAMGQEQQFGPVRHVVAVAGYREGRPEHWKTNGPMGGGAMMDMGVYPLQGARYVLGEEPIRVLAQTSYQRPEMFEGRADETTMVQLEFPSGAVAQLTTSLGFGGNYLKARAQQGWFQLEPFSSYGGITGRSSDGPIDFPAINQQATQMDDQARSIRDDQPMRVPGLEGLLDMRVVDAVYASIASGNAVELDPWS